MKLAAVRIAERLCGLRFTTAELHSGQILDLQNTVKAMNALYDAAQRDLSTLKQANTKMTHDLEVPQVQYTDRIVAVSVAAQRRVLTSQTVQKTVEVPQVQVPDRVVGVHVMTQRRMSLPSRISSSSSSSGGGRDKRCSSLFSCTLFLLLLFVVNTQTAFFSSGTRPGNHLRAHRHMVSCLDCVDYHQPVYFLAAAVPCRCWQTVTLLEATARDADQRTQCAPSLRAQEHPLQQFSFP